MSRRDETFKRRLVGRLAREGMKIARPNIRKGVGSGFGSKTLASALRVNIYNNETAALYIPHYWAIFVHDGRGGFGPKNQGFYVWFRDPNDDPRLIGGKTPERLYQKRRLTAAEYREGLRRNRRHLDNGGDPYDMPMIVTRIVRRGMAPSQFFSNRHGMRGFAKRAGTIAKRDFSAHVKSRLGSLLNVRGTVNVNLPV
jgi:hypothetical protein